MKNKLKKKSINNKESMEMYDLSFICAMIALRRLLSCHLVCRSVLISLSDALFCDHLTVALLPFPFLILASMHLYISLAVQQGEYEPRPIDLPSDFDHLCDSHSRFLQSVFYVCRQLDEARSTARCSLVSWHVAVSENIRIIRIISFKEIFWIEKSEN